MNNKIIACLFTICLSVGTTATMGATVDMTTAGSAATVNGALFSTSFPNTGAGSGAIDAFLRTQQARHERGFNTDASAPTAGLDQKPGCCTHATRLGELQSVSIDGAGYFLLFLDINEGGDGLISLHELELYVNTTTGSANSYAELGTLIWDMDGIEETHIQMANGAGGSFGSGDFDYSVLFPVAVLAGFAPGDYLYLYNEFGDAGDPGQWHTAGAGFEEWAAYECVDGVACVNPSPVPVPAAVWLFGSGLLGLVSIAQRKKAV